MKPADIVVVFECSVKIQQDLKRGVGHYDQAQVLERLDFQTQGLLRMCRDGIVITKELFVDLQLLFQTV